VPATIVVTVNATVMIVEDDAAVRTAVGDYLRAAGYSVTAVADGGLARDKLAVQTPDVLVLDRMLPLVGGDVLCAEIRKNAPHVMVIMLTALDSVAQRISGLEHGADDYLVKPFSMRELQLRIETLLRRGQKSPLVPMEIGPFRIDPARRIAFLNNTTIPLTTREYELLLFFTHHPDEVFTRDDILREVWGWTFGEASTVTVHVRRLREKIEPEPRYPRYLLTEWGAGYRFTVGGGAAGGGENNR
jgi:DNA-binding response OmpR family regulator